MKYKSPSFFFLFLFICFFSSIFLAENSLAKQVNNKKIYLAVSSNFSSTIKALVQAYHQQSAYQVVLIFGATGKHYAQIKNGAPYDLFFSADVDRPQRLESEGLGVEGSRFTYAIGKLVLWKPTLYRNDRDESLLVEQELFVHIDENKAINLLKDKQVNFLAMANPKLAPYGKAALETLKSLQLWQHLNKDLVRGENIGQTFQFVQSGNADLGFVAYSQVIAQRKIIEQQLSQNSTLTQRFYWLVPQTYYRPIKQQAIILQDKLGSHDFIQFVKSELGRKIIQQNGYELESKDKGHKISHAK